MKPARIQGSADLRQSQLVLRAAHFLQNNNADSGRVCQTDFTTLLMALADLAVIAS